MINIDVKRLLTQPIIEPKLCRSIGTSVAFGQWQVSSTQSVLVPELAWEGGLLCEGASLRSASEVPVKQLRDPAIFVEDDKIYLLYCGAGESAIGIAQLFIK